MNINTSQSSDGKYKITVSSENEDEQKKLDEFMEIFAKLDEEDLDFLRKEMEKKGKEND